MSTKIIYSNMEVTNYYKRTNSTTSMNKVANKLDIPLTLVKSMWINREATRANFDT